MKSTHGKTRVLVTGIGMISPIGNGKAANWNSALAGSHGIQKVPDLNSACKIGGPIPLEIFDPNDHPTSLKSPIYSLSAAIMEQTITDSNLNYKALSETQLRRSGILISNQYGVQEVGKTEDPGKLRLIKQMNHLVPAQLAIKYGFKGHIQGSTFASGGGGIAIGEAFRLIRHGYMDRIVVGGLDYSVNDNAVGGMDSFGALTRSHNDSPEEAMRPFDKKRSGTVLSDGGAFLMLESEESALSRGVNQVYGEVAGFGMTCDAFHILRPTDKGAGLISAIQEALLEANVTPKQVSAFNCHATSTPKGDASEAKCITSLLGAAQKYGINSWDDFRALSPEQIGECTEGDLSDSHMPVLTAFKGNLGHCVNGAGALESAFAFLCLEKQFVTKIRNLHEPLTTSLRFATENEPTKLDVIVKNSLVFGGINASLVFKKYQSTAKL